MSIDPNNLPEGRPVSFGTPGGNRALAWVRNGELHAYHGGGGETYEKHERFTYIPLVPVPDGMTPKDAQRILAEHVEWVPLPGGPTETWVGKRVRVAWGHSRVEDKVHRIDSEGNAHLLGVPGEWDLTSGDWFVHSDDVPDPDADLIERMAKALLDYYQTDATDWPGYARAALAVIREDGAK